MQINHTSSLMASFNASLTVISLAPFSEAYVLRHCVVVGSARGAFRITGVERAEVSMRLAGRSSRLADMIVNGWKRVKRAERAEKAQRAERFNQ